MRTLFIDDHEIVLSCMDEDEYVEMKAPWVAYTLAVEGGIIAFESVDDYQTFLNTK